MPDGMQSTDSTLTDHHEDTEMAEAGTDNATGPSPALEAAMEHHRNGDLAGAKAAYEAVLEAEPDNPDAHHLIGMIAYQTGNVETAIEHLQQAIAAQPDNPHFQLNFGEALRANGQADAAMAAYRRAVALDHSLFEAHMNLGLLAFENSYVGEGIESLRHAVALQPENPGAQSNLGLALRQIGEFDAALIAFAKAVVATPEQPGCRQNFIETLDGGPFIKVPDSVRRDFETAYMTDGIDHQSLNSAAIALLQREEPLQGILAMTVNEDSQSDIQALAEAVAGGVFDSFMTDPLLRGMMSRTVIADPGFELIFTRLRRVIIEEGVAPQPPESVVGRQPQFVAALAMQAHNTEYAWSEMQGETALVGMLLGDLSKAVDALNDEDSAAAPLWSGIMVGACYRAMDSFAKPEKLLSTDVAGLPFFITNLVAQQLAEPALEADVAENIEFITEGQTPAPETSDALAWSAHPRWATFAPEQPSTLADVLRAQVPGIQPPAFAEGAVAILVPGCRTGKPALELAVQYPQSLVLGVDEVKANVAYAWRKAMQMEMTNVRFAQGSIDDLSGADQHFHLIDVPDALSQTDNTVGSWQTLVDLLEPRGFMKVGLYSETGRAGVAAARDVLSGSSGDAVEDIRAARSQLLELAGDHPGRAVMAAQDFYTLKGARDTLMPKAESTFTIPSLAAMLGQLGLEFLGFHITDPTPVGYYLEMFPDAETLADLDKWQKVEAEHPMVFATPENFGIYRFWCQKRA